MKRPEIEKVWQYIDAHREEYLELLKRFCSQPSVSAQNIGIREMAELVRHLTGLSDKLTCQFYEPQEAEEALPELDVSLLPATAIYCQRQYTGIAFHGVTGGKEMNSLVLALYNVAGPGQEIDKRIEKKLRKLARKSEMKIFVSLSCHHCAKQVITCQQMAAVSEMVEARMIDARLYPHLAEKYKI